VRIIARFLAVTCSLGSHALPQTSTLPAFEAASVKVSSAQTGRGSLRGGPGTDDPSQISFSNVTLLNVILRAYDRIAFQVAAPEWMSARRYDIAAAVPAGASKEECNRMLQTLLAERFHLVIHHETRSIPGFDLAAGRGATKLKASSESGSASSGPAEGPPKTDPEGYPELTAPGIAMMEGARAGGVIVFVTAKSQLLSALTQFLSREYQMPISDKTGLQGNFDFRLAFSPKPPGALSAPTSADQPPNAADDVAPNLIMAVQQQLGLRLNARKIPTDVLVVDRADPVPVEN